MFRVVRKLPLLSFAVAALASPVLYAQCDVWSANSPNPDGLVLARAALVADPTGGNAPVVILPGAFVDPNTGNVGVGVWNGATLTQFADVAPTTGIDAAVVYNNQLVISVENSVNAAVMAWNGSSWITLQSASDTGDPDDGQANDFIHCLAVYNGKLIAGGGFTTIDHVTANGIAAWDGTSWQPLDSGLTPSDSQGIDGYTGRALSLLVVNNGAGSDLYVAGFFGFAGGVFANNVAMWDGGWHALGGGVGDIPASIIDYFNSINFPDYAITAVNAYSLTLYNSKVVVSGTFAAAGGDDATDTSDNARVLSACVAAWDPSTSQWSGFGAGLSNTVPVANGFFQAVKACVLGTDLYVGGIFDQADSVAVNGVARWSSGAWHAVDPSGLLGLVNNFGDFGDGVYNLVSYNGNLVATGTGLWVYTDTSDPDHPQDYLSSDASFFATYTPACPCPADFDGNHTVNVSDIFAFLRAWFAHSPSADIDGNSVVNVSDIFAFLRHWFAHC